jgi:hypothetical protein
MRLIEFVDLDNAIFTLKSAVDLTSEGHRDKRTLLLSLAVSFTLRFERFGELVDITTALSLEYRVTHLIHGDHYLQTFAHVSLGTTWCVVAALPALSSFSHGL